MGKEWLLNWGGGGGGGGGSGKKRRSRGGGRGGGVMEEASSTAAGGCICAVFNFYLPFTFLPHHHHHARPSFRPDAAGDCFLQDEPADGRRKGLEAPRNSLELNERTLEPSSSSSTMKNDENLNIPMNIRIKTTCEMKSSSPRGSTSSYRGNNSDDSSPGIRPPNLVARLMGLDLLPDQTGSQTGSPSSFSRQSTSPSLTNRSSTLSSHGYRHSDTNLSGTVSLPETPRVSLARKSDVVDHHRLSLQNIEERMDVSIYGVRKMGRKSLEEESAAARIVRRMKEKVGRRVGVDITNTVRDNRNDDNLVVLKPKKTANPLRKFKEDSSSSNQSTPSCSPRLSFLDHKKKSPLANAKPVMKDQDPPRSTPVSQVHRPQVQGLENSRKEHNKPIRTENRATKPDVIRNKKDEPFIRTTASNKSNVSNKKLKKSAPSKELFNISVPTLVPKRKDLSLPVTHFNDKQESDALSLKRCTQSSTFSYKEERMLPTKTQLFQENIIQIPSRNNNSFTESDYHRYYIQRILKRVGIDEDTPVSLAKWYSPTHPLDPSVFHYLELFQPTCFGPMKLSRRCERKLVFHLVDELLVEILKLSNPWGGVVTKKGQFRGAELVNVLCEKVGGFPGANCKVLEDIDALIDVDLRGLDFGKPVLFEDFESIAVDIERDVVEKILDETVRSMLPSIQNDRNGLQYNVLYQL